MLFVLSVMAPASINLCSFNCKKLKTSIVELNALCNHDFIFLHESWLARSEHSLFCDIHNDFTSFGVSSMNEEEHILTGRPFGGTAIL